MSGECVAGSWRMIAKGGVRTRPVLAVLASVALYKSLQYYTVLVSMQDPPPNTVELIAANAFLPEVHHVQAGDGYIIEVHRVLDPKKRMKKGKPPVFLMHGMFSSSTTFVSSGQNSLAFLLVERGYDVWLGNIRGNKYGQKHNVYNTTEERFWNFTVDELATQDLPVQIDYILQATNNKKLYFIGFSMGMSLGCVLLSTRTEYNDKISLAIGLAPGIYVSDVKTPALLFLVQRYAPFAMNYYGHGDWFPNVDKMLWEYCDSRLPTYYLCRFMYNSLGPSDEKDEENLNLYLSSSFTSTSLKIMVHLGQNLQSEEPRFFREKHNETEADIYPLKLIRSPMVVFYSDSDYIVTSEDILRAKEKLPQIELMKVPISGFNHLDFMFGKNAPRLVYRKIFDLIADPRFV